MSDLNFVAIKGIVKNIEREENGYKVILLNRQVNDFDEDDFVDEEHIIHCSYDPFTEMIMKAIGKSVIAIGELCSEERNNRKPLFCADIIIMDRHTYYGRFSSDMEKNISIIVNLLLSEFPRYC